MSKVIKNKVWNKKIECPECGLVFSISENQLEEEKEEHIHVDYDEDKDEDDCCYDKYINLTCEIETSARYYTNCISCASIIEIDSTNIPQVVLKKSAKRSSEKLALIDNIIEMLSLIKKEQLELFLIEIKNNLVIHERNKSI